MKLSIFLLLPNLLWAAENCQPEINRAIKILENKLSTKLVTEKTEQNQSGIRAKNNPYDYPDVLRQLTPDEKIIYTAENTMAQALIVYLKNKKIIAYSTFSKDFEKYIPAHFSSKPLARLRQSTVMFDDNCKITKFGIDRGGVLEPFIIFEADSKDCHDPNYLQKFEQSELDDITKAKESNIQYSINQKNESDKSFEYHYIDKNDPQEVEEFQKELAEYRKKYAVHIRRHWDKWLEERKKEIPPLVNFRKQLCSSLIELQKTQYPDAVKIEDGKDVPAGDIAQ